jgi:alpha-L-fucosidase
MSSSKSILKPNEDQLKWADAEFGMFCHFGMNTFVNKEWSDGTFPPSKFNPTKLDCEQWVTAAKAAGINYMVLTTKHHDGFCLWQTKTTDYSVKSSPWKNGKGDVVAEFVAACRKHGMKFGFYLSPWDRHEPKYKDKDAYDSFYAAQLTELLTQYANKDEIFELWFDGAGSTGRVYDWKRFMAIIKEHQSRAVIFNMGDHTIRWVGNENGYAPYPTWNVAKSEEKDNYLRSIAQTDIPGEYWIPAECDVPIHHFHWFHHTGLKGIIYKKMLFSKDKLVELYERSIGHGANLLLNLAPTKEGLLSATDITRLNEMVAEVRKRYSKPLATISGRGKELVLKLPQKTSINAIILQEDIREGERIRKYHLEALIDGQWKIITLEEPGISVGHKKIDKFVTLQTDAIKIIVEDSVAEPIIRNFQAFSY